MSNISKHSSCKKATVLMSKSMEQSLSIQEQTALHAHLAICKTCCFCFKQLKSLQTTLGHYKEAIFLSPPSGQKKLSDDARQRIKNHLKSQYNKES